MCGIFGLVDKTNKKVPQSILYDAAEKLNHRGPDHQNIHQAANIGFTHCRLKVIDPSDHANQPFEKYDCHLIFNGAIYNYIELRSELESKAYTFRSNSDTEVLLSAYDHWGPECVKYFRGMWAFAIHDSKNNNIFISRDQASIKPLYFFENERYFGFSSEIKPLLQKDMVVPRINPLLVYEFIEYGLHDHREETMFDGIFRLTGGTNLFYDISSHSISKRTFRSVYTEKKQPETQDPITTFKNIFFESVQLISRADVPFGSSLSGGMDSSSIVSSMHDQQLLDDSFSSFSACFPGYEYDESAFINILTKSTSTNNIQVNPNGNDFIKALEKLIYIQEEPFAGAGVFSQFTVAQEVNKYKYKVLIDGQGGDEILAGYDQFYPYFLKELFSKNPLRAIHEGIAFLFGYQNSWNDALKRWKNRSQKEKKEKANWFLYPINAENRFLPKKIDSVSELSESLLKYMGLPCLLRYADKNMMHFGIESRFPFLDQKLVAFCLQLDANLKIKSGLRKHILRETMQSILPEKIRKRKDKLGYATPQKKWVAEHSDYFSELLAKGHALPFIDKEIFRENTTEDKNWRLTITALWIKVFDIKT